MTQHQLAEAAGMPQPSIARIERGLVVPRTATLMTILGATGHRIAVEPIDPPVDLDAIRRLSALAVPQRTWRALGRTAKNPTTSPIRIVRRLRRFALPFVLIGELAEIAHGAPRMAGRVVEVCHAMTEVARQRLDMALDDLGGIRQGPSSVETQAGRLHLLVQTATGDDYDVLLRNAVRMPIDTGIQVPVASLDDLTRIRLARNTPDDRAAAAVLRAIADGRAMAGD